jgi:hypothetical protein
MSREAVPNLKPRIWVGAANPPI